MAKRGWDHGWPQYSWAQPIKKVLENDQINSQAAARAASIKAAEAAEAVRESARQESIEERKQEHNMLRAARADVLAALVIAADLVAPMRVIAATVAAFCKPDEHGNPPKINPKDAMGLIVRHATLIQKAVGAAEAVIQLSRLERGATTSNIGLGLGFGEVGDDTSPEAIDEELEAIAEVLHASRSTRAAHSPSALSAHVPTPQIDSAPPPEHDA